MRSDRGFTIVETLVASVMLGLVTAALLSTMSYAAAESARTRARTLASTDANAQIERIVGLLQIATTAGATDLERCALLTAPGAPLDVAAGGTLTGACPFQTANDVPLPSSTLTRTVALTQEDFGIGRPGFHIRIAVTGSPLTTPVIYDTQMRR